jgi:site-specific DNA recombinase
VSKMPTNRSNSIPKLRRTPEEKGMPDEAALIEMATVYLECQNRLWPQLVALGLVPANTSENSSILAREFRNHFLGYEIPPDPQFEFDVELALAYDRYSDPGSNPRSLAQQLRLQLEKAGQNQQFIPWQYVFADAAVTGTISNRRGYLMAKAVIEKQVANVRTLYIDEIGRASRDAIEALYLGRLINDCEKRLIGVSDGFDSTLPHAKMMLHMFAMMQEWFIDQLREKVKRGMDYGFDTDANLQAPPFSYVLVDRVDERGNPMYGKKGEQLKSRQIDENTRRFILVAFDLYANRGKSTSRIAAIFNRLRAGGISNWNKTRISKLLRRRLYVGIATYRMTKMVRNGKTIKIVKRPRREWKVRRVRHLQIVPYALWKKTQNRLKIVNDAWREQRVNGGNRAEVYPNRLIRPTCGLCKHVMYMGSSGKNATYFCPNANDGAKSCKFRGFKNIRIIEDCVLNVILGEVLTEEVAGRLVESINLHIQQAAKVPKEDTSHLLADLREAQRKIDNLYSLVESKGNFPGADERIAKYERDKKELNQQIRDARKRSTPAPDPVTLEQIRPYFDRIGELLQQDLATAAPLLKVLTGPIEVFPTGKKQGNRHVWEAKFTANFAHVCLEIGKRSELPTKGLWEYLLDHSWKFDLPVVAKLAKVPKYEATAPAVAYALAKGVSKNALAIRFRTDWQTIDDAEAFAKDGTRPPAIKRSAKKTEARKRIPIEQAHGQDIVRRVDELHQSFFRIGQELGISESSVRRVYDQLRPEQLNQTIADGTRRKRNRRYTIAYERVLEARELLKQGVRVDEVVRRLNLSSSSVYRELAEIRKEGKVTSHGKRASRRNRVDRGL